jgi:hypothetical protein
MVLAVLALAMDVAPAQAGGVAATLVLHGGRVWTGRAGADAEAVAVRDQVIIVVGTSAEVLALRDAGTRVIDLAGRRVVPGFIDAHVHFLGGGDELLGADLRGTPTMEAFARGLGEVATRTPAGTWITTGTWDHERWPSAPLPTAAMIDRFVPDHPVFVQRLDGHMAVANSLALSLAGITAETRDPSGGTIVRLEDGSPAGVLKDNAMDLVSSQVPVWTEDQRRARAEAALAHAASLGVTGVHDMGVDAATLRTYQKLHREGRLTCRISCYVPLGNAGSLRAAGVQQGFGDAWLGIHGVKAFVDGSLGSTTALFFDPYADAPETAGLAVSGVGPGGPLERQVHACVTDGLQPAVHAIGDKANHLLLNLYERAGPEIRASRPRIEHAQHLRPADIARFASLGVVASMQPYHAIDDGRWCDKRIGPERSKTTYAFRDLLDAGATLAFGSDWPVAPLSPLIGIHAAVTRRTLDGAHPEGWVPAQKISAVEALRAYTEGSAHAGFAEARLGRIAPGRDADLVVLDRDILTVDAEELERAQVDLTVVGGRVVYER